MQNQSLFGHLATKFNDHPENLATEALNYILNRSSVAKQAFLHYVAQTGAKVTENLIFQTQASGKDGGIPDLVGVDSDGREVLIVEAKFWAGLTDNQPVVYLQRLPEETNSVLLFISPAMRFPTLQAELTRRCEKSGISIKINHIDEELLVGRISKNQALALASWRSVLLAILRRLDASGQTEVVSDVMQLQGLCDRMDSDSFLPIRSEELTSNIGTRMYQYCGLVDDVTHQLVAEGLASTEKFRPGRSSGYYGRSMIIHGFGCFLQVNYVLWANHRATPLWLSVKGGDWKFSQLAKERLSKVEMEDPPRLLLSNGELVIPLDLPTNVERDEVVKSLLDQVREVAGYLKGNTA